MRRLGLERLPREIEELLEGAASNLHEAANEFDWAVQHPAGPSNASLDHATTARRLRRETALSVARHRRTGPDGVRALAVSDALEDVVCQLDALAWAWRRCPLTAATPLLETLRDLTRAGAAAALDYADPVAVLVHLERCVEVEREAREWKRRTRQALLAQTTDPRVGLCGSRLVRETDSALAAAVRLRLTLQVQALA